MCFYLQQHLLNKEKKKPSLSCSAFWGRALAPAKSSPKESSTVASHIEAFQDRACRWGRGSGSSEGLTGLEAAWFLRGLRGDPAARAEHQELVAKSVVA